MSIHNSIIRRFFQIAFYATKHLGGYLLGVILRLLRIGRRFRQKHEILSDISRAARLRLFLQDVSGALIKLGQIMAMRPDFLPEEYIEELLKLLDEVPPFDPQISREVIEEELGSEISILFQTFEEEPMAAASFGQVHAATLHNGDEVVIKVQRPEVPGIIVADLRLFRLATFLIDASGLTNRARLKPLFEDFSEWTREELDYRTEGSYVQQLYDKAARSKTERIPKVYWDFTSARVLTLERLRGIWVKQIIQGLQTNRELIIEELSRRNTNLLQISQNIFRNALRQIFDYGIYHADPHAANLVVMKNGVIGYVDFGITGKITERAKGMQVKVHVALESGDFGEFYATVLEMIDPPYYANLERFERVVRRSYAVWLNAQHMGGANPRDKSFARLMIGLTNAAQRSGVAFSSMQVRIFRTLAIVDAVLLQFAPTLDVQSEFREFFRAYKIRRLIHHDIPALVHKLPDAINTISEHLSKEVLTISKRVSKVRRFLRRGFQFLSILLIVGLFGGFIMHRTTGEWLSRLQIKPSYAVIGVLLAAIFFGWLSHLLHLRSIVQDNVIGPRDREN